MTDAPRLALRPHPQGVPWPTDSWSHAQPDPRVDRAELDRLLDYALSETDPEDLEHTRGVVVVQGGKIVAERYSGDGGPDRPCHSMSVAKSFTASFVGILVRLGKLDISSPMGVKEWSADDKRSRITIDQMLRMVGKGDAAAFASTLPYDRRSPSPQSDGLYGAHFWIAPGDLGIFYAMGIGGQRVMICPKLDLVLVRLGKTAPEKMGAVGRYCDSLIGLFRPTA